MENKVKVFAMYLPQFHQIPENDEFWGAGFTDWVTVKNARPLFEGHQQPRVPLNDNYYDLSVMENVLWQANLAKRNGIYGFGVYHYWFNNEKNLLTKPAEILRDSGKDGINYFFVWDNGNWVRSWSNVPGNDWAPIYENNEGSKREAQILIPYILGGEADWTNHYRYLKTHFISENYEKIDNKPVFCIYSYSKEILKMCEYWNDLAQKDGFNGIYFIFRYKIGKSIPKNYSKYLYEPIYSGWEAWSLSRIWQKSKKIFHINITIRTRFYDYDVIWKKIISRAKADNSLNTIHGAFVGYDDSPRRGKGSRIIQGASPTKFGRYFKELVDISTEKHWPYIFLTAWNEWSEGAYLEPDKENHLSYLNEIKKIVY